MLSPSRLSLDLEATGKKRNHGPDAQVRKHNLKCSHKSDGVRMKMRMIQVKMSECSNLEASEWEAKSYFLKDAFIQREYVATEPRTYPIDLGRVRNRLISWITRAHVFNFQEGPSQGIYIT